MAAPVRSPREMFRRGAVKSLPFLIVMIPFALLFGVAATEAGMDVAQVLGFSVLVLAGASQFTAVQLLSDNASVIIVPVLPGSEPAHRCIRHPWCPGCAMPRARKMAWSPMPWWIKAMPCRSRNTRRIPARPGPEAGLLRRRVRVVVCLPWMIFSWLGATVGRAIPDDIALDFAMPITFLAMIAPMLRTPAHLAACFVAILGSLIFAGLPSGLGLLIASPLGMAVGAAVEIWSNRKAAA